jgi:hypothetical protein
VCERSDQVKVSIGYLGPGGRAHVAEAHALPAWIVLLQGVAPRDRISVAFRMDIDRCSDGWFGCLRFDSLTLHGFSGLAIVCNFVFDDLIAARVASIHGGIAA